MDYIGEHYNDPDITVGSIAQHLGISEGHLSHMFKKETDYTLLNYLTRYRIHKAMELLRDCRRKVYEVAEQVGYKDITYFSATFKKVVGMSPSEYQDTCPLSKRMYMHMIRGNLCLIWTACWSIPMSCTIWPGRRWPTGWASPSPGNRGTAAGGCPGWTAWRLCWRAAPASYSPEEKAALGAGKE